MVSLAQGKPGGLLLHNCNMNATASAIYAHRHTVAYRLDRVKELSGLDRRDLARPAARVAIARDSRH